MVHAFAPAHLLAAGTRKFSEAVLAGCVPVLIADMPAWPFAQRLRYSEFSVEFDWRTAVRRPSAIVEALLRVTPAELQAKQRDSVHGFPTLTITLNPAPAT